MRLTEEKYLNEEAKKYIGMRDEGKYLNEELEEHI
jgi:hypothetical protein